jgi:hypothetical protein
MRSILVIALVLPLFAQQKVAEATNSREKPGLWKRHVGTPKDAWFDSPEPHALEYFTKYPALLDESGDFCFLCSPEKKRATAAAAPEPKAEVHLVGAIKGFSVYDFFYRFTCQGCVDWKSVLVKTGPDSYREIYHREPTQVDARALPSEVVAFGSESLLKSRYFVGGTHGVYLDDYYWFDRVGPTLVDFSPLVKAIRVFRGEKPENPFDSIAKFGSFQTDDSSPLMPMGYQAIVTRDGKEPVRLTVNFRLDRGRVVVTGTSADPISFK